MVSFKPEELIRFSPDDISTGPNEIDPEGDDYLQKLTQALKKNKNQMPYKDRVTGPERIVSNPDGIPLQENPGSQQWIAAQQRAEKQKKQPTPSPVQARQSGSSTAIPRQSYATQQNVVSHASGTFPMGTILLFEDQSIAVYKDKRPEKEYEVVLMLKDDGHVESRGIMLETYELKSIGMLPPEFVLRIQRRKTWDRDEIIYHLNTFDYCVNIPHPVTPEQRMSQASSSGIPKLNITPENKLVSGREITISFGPNQQWKAIYWGEDDLGTIIAHNSGKKWSLMHMDLKRFKDSMEYGSIIDRTLMDEIHTQVGNSV